MTIAEQIAEKLGNNRRFVTNDGMHLDELTEEARGKSTRCVINLFPDGSIIAAWPEGWEVVVGPLTARLQARR